MTRSMTVTVIAAPIVRNATVRYTSVVEAAAEVRRARRRDELLHEPGRVVLVVVQRRDERARRASRCTTTSSQSERRREQEHEPQPRSLVEHARHPPAKPAAFVTGSRRSRRHVIAGAGRGPAPASSLSVSSALDLVPRRRPLRVVLARHVGTTVEALRRRRLPVGQLAVEGRVAGVVRACRTSCRSSARTPSGWRAPHRSTPRPAPGRRAS